jgi:hypothetical protein
MWRIITMVLLSQGGTKHAAPWYTFSRAGGGAFHQRAIMDEDALNTSIRQFPKTFHVSTQHE